MIDCEKLPGHLRDICAGEHRQSNGKPYTDSERAEIISRFTRTVVDAGDLPKSALKLHPPKPKRSDVGTRLHAVIQRDAGKIECSECRDEVTRLNLLPASAVIDQADLIAEGIVERGQRKAPKFWQRWGATLAPGLAKAQALSWIYEATGYPWQSQIRHLTFHVYPTKKHDAWQWNLLQLAQRWPMFTGKKIIAIATDGTTVSADAVLQYCEQIGISWDHVVFRQNNSRIREVATWQPMLQLLDPATAKPNEVVFACHGKGVRHEHRDEHIKAWAEVMYQSCLDYWPLAEEHLKSKVATGSFRKFGGFKTACRNFHYSGTFFWWRLAEIGKREWRNVEQKYWGTENWLSCQAEASETGVLFHDNCVSLYEYKYWEDVVWPAWEQWKQDNARFACVR
jgi:hypothetical protein